MFWIILVLALIVAFWLWLKPAWAPKPAKVQDDVTKGLRQAGDRAGKTVTGLRGKLWWERTRLQGARRLQRWVTSARIGNTPDAVPVIAWIEALPEHDLTEVYDQVTHTVNGLGLDAAWLLDDRLNNQPELTQSMQQVMALACTAVWRARSAQLQAQAFTALERWQAKPAKNDELGQRIYAALVQQGLVTMKPELYLGPAKARAAEMTRAIKDMIATHPEQVNAIVRDLLDPKAVAQDRQDAKESVAVTIRDNPQPEAAA